MCKFLNKVAIYIVLSISTLVVSCEDENPANTGPQNNENSVVWRMTVCHWKSFDSNNKLVEDINNTDDLYEGQQPLLLTFTDLGSSFSIKANVNASSADSWLLNVGAGSLEDTLAATNGGPVTISKTFINKYMAFSGNSAVWNETQLIDGYRYDRHSEYSKQ